MRQNQLADEARSLQIHGGDDHDRQSPEMLYFQTQSVRLWFLARRAGLGRSMGLG